MGLLDYNYTERDNFYYLLNTKTGLYFGCFSKETPNKPVWVSKEHATAFEEMYALRLQRRLETQYSPYQKIVLRAKDWL